jgi:hypothetical protein
MKIAVESNLALIPIKRRLELEGNQVVDLSIAEFAVTSKPNGLRLPSMMSGERFNTVAMTELGYKVSDYPADAYVSRWFDCRGGFGEKVFLGIPIVGLMDGGKGAGLQVGTVGNYVISAKIEAIFSRPELTALLKELRHSGFVSFWVSSEDGLVTEMETGVPAWGMYNIFEGLTGTLAEFFLDPIGTKLLKSWTVSLVVSRFPYPRDLITPQVCSITGITAEVEKHFWLGDASGFRNSFTTNSTIVGVATGWADTSWRANALVVGTCGNIGVGEVQYRTDGSDAAEIVYSRLKASLLS